MANRGEHAGPPRMVDGVIGDINNKKCAKLHVIIYFFPRQEDCLGTLYLFLGAQN